MDTRLLCLFAVLAGATALTLSGSKTINGQTAAASITIPVPQLSRISFSPGRLPSIGQPSLPSWSGLLPGLRPPFGGWPLPGMRPRPPSGESSSSEDGSQSGSQSGSLSESSSGEESSSTENTPTYGMPGFPGFQLGPLMNLFPDRRHHRPGHPGRPPCRHSTTTTSATTTTDESTEETTTEDAETTTTEESTSSTEESTANSTSTTEESSTDSTDESSTDSTDESSTDSSNSTTTVASARRKRTPEGTLLREIRQIHFPFLHSFFNRTRSRPRFAHNTALGRPLNLPGISSLPAIPGLRDNVQLARERVLKAIGGTDMQTGIDKAVGTALRSEEPQPRLAALIYTIADIYALAAQNCPLLVGASFLFQEAFNVVSGILSALNNTMISASLNITTT